MKAMNGRNLKEGQWEDRKQWSLGVGQRRKSFKTGDDDDDDDDLRITCAYIMFVYLATAASPSNPLRLFKNCSDFISFHCFETFQLWYLTLVEVLVLRLQMTFGTFLCIWIIITGYKVSYTFMV
jgi:hypothetical protein